MINSFFIAFAACAAFASAKTPLKCEETKKLTHGVHEIIAKEGGRCNKHAKHPFRYPPTFAHQPSPEWCEIADCRKLLGDVIKYISAKACEDDMRQADLYVHVLEKCHVREKSQYDEDDYANRRREDQNGGKVDANVVNGQELEKKIIAKYNKKVKTELQKAEKRAKRAKKKTTTPAPIANDEEDDEDVEYDVQNLRRDAQNEGVKDENVVSDAQLTKKIIEKHQKKVEKKKHADESDEDMHYDADMVKKHSTPPPKLKSQPKPATKPPSTSHANSLVVFPLLVVVALLT